MQTIRRYIIVSVLLSCGFVGNAQQADKILESKIYQDYGTMLETLMKGNSISKENAVKYLETVLNFDENATSGIQLTDFDTKLNQLKLASKGKLSQQDFMTALNGNLLTLLPPASRQQMVSNLEVQMRLNSVAGELKSGQIGVNTLSLMSDLIADIGANKQAKLKREAAAQKLAQLTPTLTMLKAADTVAYTKLKIIDEVDSPLNWITLNNPPILQEGDPQTTSTNHAILQNGALTLSDPYKLFDKQLFSFDILRCYKNPQQFDFSKDFAMTLYFKMSDNNNLYFNIQIGKGYHVFVIRNYDGGNRFHIQSPIGYQTTEKYGNLIPLKDETVKKSSATVDKELGIKQFNNSHFSTLFFPKKSVADHNGMLKLHVVKKGNVFTVKFNDLPGEISTTVNYFPDKYFLGFSAKSPFGRGTSTEIHKLELEHL